MSENPYRVRGTDIPALHGRQGLVHQLRGHLTKPTPDHVSVVGPTLFGKSVLLHHIASLFGRTERDHYAASVYWDLRHGTPRTNAEFRRRFAEKAKQALAERHPDLADSLEPDDEALGDPLLDLVFEALECRADRLLAVLDGFDHVLAEAGITRNLWDYMRQLAQRASLRLVTGSRDRLRELCKTEESRTSDFWEIFYDTPLQVGCFEQSDWSGFLEPFELKRVKLDESARKEIINWTGGAPVLAAALASRLFSEAPDDVTLSKRHVDKVAEALLETPGESLAALWDDCSTQLRSDLVELGRGVEPIANIPESRRKILEQRGFAVSARGGLRSSCRLMKRYAAEREEGITSLRRLFGDAEAFEDNIRGVFELRLDQIVQADPELLGRVRKAVRDLYPQPEDSLIWFRNIRDRALDLIWNAELPTDRSLPDTWKRADVFSHNDKLPHSRGAQCGILRKITGGPEHSAVARYVTKPTALLVDHIHGVGNFGQHLEEHEGQTVSVAVAAAFCLSAIALCERLAEDLRSQAKRGD
ncbi:hypothetical protein [Candidatus Palauibacter sp.]|uniref:hypothetical protein n=1 Tax=Candidatus Palauibacter sp. TaxID=3101350 RepID=UPI003AF27EA1